MTPRRADVARALLHGLAHKRGVRLEGLAVLPDRVHLLLSLRTSDCAGSVVRELRGRSALLLLRELPELRVALGGHLLWSETYGISTVSPGALAPRVAKLERMNGAHPAGEAESARCSSC
jgi:putative transposase